MRRPLSALAATIALFGAAPASACLPGNFSFFRGSMTVSPNDQDMVDSMVAQWRSEPGTRWILSPADNSMDPPEIKVPRARLRAEAVRDALIARGIPAANLEIPENHVAAVAAMSGTSGTGTVWPQEIELPSASGEPRRRC